jgi:hypothetical protein
MQIQRTKPMRNHADPDPEKAFFMKIYLKYGRKYSRPKNISSKFKSPFERKEIRFFLPFGQFPCYWIWIRIPNTDPDLG